MIWSAPLCPAGEDDEIVYAVEEFRLEVCPQRIHYLLARPLEILSCAQPIGSELRRVDVES